MDSNQYTSCCASPGSPTYQYNKLSQGLNVSPAYFTSLMNNLLHELPPDIREYIDCIMDDVIILHLTSKPMRKFWKVSCLCWKNMACYSQSTKFTLLDLKLNIWDCYFQAKTIYPLSHHWVHMWKLSPPYQYLWQHRVLNPSLVVLFTWHNFCQSLLSLSNPSMIFWKLQQGRSCRQNSTFTFNTPTAKAKVENVHLIFKSIGCLFIPLTLRI